MNFQKQLIETIQQFFQSPLNPSSYQQTMRRQFKKVSQLIYLLSLSTTSKNIPSFQFPKTELGQKQRQLSKQSPIFQNALTYFHKKCNLDYHYWYIKQKNKYDQDTVNRYLNLTIHADQHALCCSPYYIFNYPVQNLDSIEPNHPRLKIMTLKQFLGFKIKTVLVPLVSEGGGIILIVSKVCQETQAIISGFEQNQEFRGIVATVMNEANKIVGLMRPQEQILNGIQFQYVPLFDILQKSSSKQQIVIRLKIKVKTCKKYLQSIYLKHQQKGYVTAYKMYNSQGQLQASQIYTQMQQKNKPKQLWHQSCLPSLYQQFHPNYFLNDKQMFSSINELVREVHEKNKQFPTAIVLCSEFIDTRKYFEYLQKKYMPDSSQSLVFTCPRQTCQHTHYYRQYTNSQKYNWVFNLYTNLEYILQKQSEQIHDKTAVVMLPPQNMKIMKMTTTIKLNKNPNNYIMDYCSKLWQGLFQENKPEILYDEFRYGQQIWMTNVRVTLKQDIKYRYIVSWVFLLLHMLRTEPTFV